jgi:hypothetical protein
MPKGSRRPDRRGWSQDGEGDLVEFEGEFETHITVRAEGPSVVDALRAWADRHGLKFHHIVLDRGLTPSQPMVSRRGRGGLSGERAEAADLGRRLAADGFAISRVKIEAAPGNRDTPASDAEAADHHSGRYFEHHVKLALDPDTDLTTLAALAQTHAAHLSRNARRVRADGRSERFVTQRCYAVGRPSAHRRLEALLAALEAGGYPVLSVEEEFVVHDSAPGVDAGWLDPGGVP